MKIVTTIAELDHPSGVTTGLVPTMGGFHRGHLQLMETARAECERVVVSLFVNPTQFGAGEDFERYPRDLARDAALAENSGVDVLFAPATQEIYPRPGTTIHVPDVTRYWEGASRPGHFEGVATVVCKLFNIVRPTTAYFGLKDLQQCRVIVRMKEDLNLPLNISLQPTVRESDGLALSSRNVYLTEGERALAPSLYARLAECADQIRGGSPSKDDLENILRHAKSQLEAVGFRVDYFELIELESMHSTRTISHPCAIVTAAHIGKTRLIDNVLL